MRKDPFAVLEVVSIVDASSFFASADLSKTPLTFSVKAGDTFGDEKENNGGGGGMILAGVDEVETTGELDRSLLDFKKLLLLLWPSKLFKSFLFHMSCVLSAIIDNKLLIKKYIQKKMRQSMVNKI